MSSAATANPVHQLPNARTNRRAKLVCLRCHEKKIKCDLQVNRRQAQYCTHCIENDAICQLRPSHRGAPRQRKKNVQHAPLQNEVSDTIYDLQNFNSPAESLFQDAQFNTSQSQLPVDAETSRVGHRTEAGLQVSSLHPVQQSTIEDSQGICPSQSSRISQPVSQQASYLGNSGYMQIFTNEIAVANTSTEVLSAEVNHTLDDIPAVLLESHMETYLDYVFTFCPIFDEDSLNLDSDLWRSQLLRHALSLFGSNVKPPLFQHMSSSEHYHRAKSLFYGNGEANPLTRIRALMLFYWWSGSPPNVVSLDSNFWWMGVTIRLAQEIGLHLEQSAAATARAQESLGLRRRIWWTLFARERITAVCHGRPCIINQEFCNVKPPSKDDFPEPEDPKAEIFIQWVRLCGIIGRVAMQFPSAESRAQNTKQTTSELITWVAELPEPLQLKMQADRKSALVRDIHLLHLPYLTTISLLYLRKSSNPLPTASIAAIVAASYVANIFEGYLARGSLRFLPGVGGWYITVAILALLHGRRVESLTAAADRHIQTLKMALTQMAFLWHSAQIFEAGLDKILIATSSRVGADEGQPRLNNDAATGSPSLNELQAEDGTDWKVFFPHATSSTSRLVEIILEEEMSDSLNRLDWPLDLNIYMDDLFQQFGNPNSDLFGVPF